MPYTPAEGLTPSTPDELFQEFYQNYQDLVDPSITENQAISSNYWKTFNVTTLNQIINLEAKFQRAQALQFQFMRDTNLTISTPAGPLPEGRLLAFKDLCKGIAYRESYEDPNTQYYEMTICFDSLDLSKTQEINDAFAKTNPQATNTQPDYYKPITGTSPETDWLDFTYTDPTGYTKKVYFKNITDSDYTQIDVKITWTLKKTGIEPRQADIESLFRERFEQYNAIGVDFDPDSYINSQDFEGVADFVLASKLTTDTTFDEGRRVCTYNQKYIINTVTFV